MLAFGTVELALLVLVVVVLGVGARFLGRNQVVEVDESHPLTLTPEQVELPLTRLLSALPGVRLALGSAFSWRLTVQRTPLWALVLAAFLVVFGPFFAAAGLVVVLLAREHADLQVLVRPSSSGSELILVGRGPLAAVRALREAAAGLSQ